MNNSSPVLIPLKKILPNPFQPRTAEDAAAVEEVAINIHRNGLLQIPSARVVNGHYELVFGHTRKAAYELLASQGVPAAEIPADKRFAEMPLYIHELDDRQMFEMAVAENIKRRDLNPIETATAMQRYMNDFQATSKQAAELFGVNDATVRGVVRLLDLPEPVQVKVATGEITQGAARKLLTIARVDEKAVEKAADKIAGGSPAEDVIETVMRNSEKAVKMWSSWDDGKPRGGEGLWTLDMAPEKFPMKHLPILTAADAAKALGVEFTARSRQELESWLRAFEEQPKQLGGGHWFMGEGGDHRIDGDVAEFLIGKGKPAVQIERIDHLLHPPACTACPFHAVADRSHYCGFKPCHDRKSKAWASNEIQRISARMKVAVYDPAADGKEFIPLCEHSYMDEYKRHAKLVEANDPGLRLQIHKGGYSEHKWTNSHTVRVILTGESAQKVKEKQRKEREKQSTGEEERQRQRELDRARGDASREFVSSYAVRQFAQVFKGMTNLPAMAALARVEVRRRKNVKPAQLLEELRADLAHHALQYLNGFNWQLLEKGPIATAKYLQGVATSWGVSLPKDFLEIAQKHQASVSAETKGKK